MNEIVDQKIAERFGKIESFCEKNGIKYKDHARLRRKLERWIDAINNYLKPLGLYIEIKEKPAG